MGRFDERSSGVGGATSIDICTVGWLICSIFVGLEFMFGKPVSVWKPPVVCKLFVSLVVTVLF